MAYDPTTETYGDWDKEDAYLFTMFKWMGIAIAFAFVVGIVHGFGQLLGFWK